ncbi:hypothetical protein SGRI78S_06747 [Streptomyces griseus subsp. griseus]
MPNLPPRCTRSAVDQIVVSVGPYVFHSSAPPSAPASSGVSTSPIDTRTRTHSGTPPAAASTAHSDGVTWTTVTASAFNSRASAGPSTTVSGGTGTTRAPTVSGATSSHTEMSNAGEIRAATTSPARSPTNAVDRASIPATARCGTPTALGLPVDPDVCSTYASDSGAMPGSTRSNSCGSSGIPVSTIRAAPVTARRLGPGHEGSTGTYTAPARQIPRTATTRSLPRGRSTATHTSGPAPRDRNTEASAAERRSNSA